MSLLKLAVTNTARGGYRSLAVFLCALLVSGFALSVTLIVQGSDDQIRLSRERLGADIVVVPEGSEARTEGALLLGQPTTSWIPETAVSKVAGIAGVAVASPQLFLASLPDDPACQASELLVVGLDPRTDFTVRPWLSRGLDGELGPGEAIGGQCVRATDGEGRVRLMGSVLRLKGSLQPTGTRLDQSIFVSLDTARDLARSASDRGDPATKAPAGVVSAIMVRVASGTDPNDVALDIMQTIPAVTPIITLEMFRSYRAQLLGLLQGLAAVLAVTLVLAMVFVGLIFSMTVNARRREIAVLRALGASRWSTFQSVLGEAVLLAAAGGLLGIVIFGLVDYLLHGAIVATFGVPYLLPPVGSFLAMVGSGLLLALAAVILAALIPALRVSLADPALAMRE